MTMTTTTLMTMALWGVGILALAAGSTLVLSRASASLRHLVWTAALGALLALPFVDAVGLRIEVPAPGWLPAAEASDVASPPIDVASPPIDVASGRFAEASAPVDVTSAPVDVAFGGAKGLAGTEALPGRVPPAPVEGPPPASRTPKADATSPIVDRVQGNDLVAWPDLLGRLWALGAFLLLITTAAGHLLAYRVTVRNVERPSPEACRRFAALCLELDFARPVRLVVSPAVGVPATWGLLRSTVVLPPEHETWSRPMLDRVLLHELAHVCRADCRTYLLGELARALHWPNPLAWFALARQRAESERACDDLVLLRGDVPSGYAQDLVSLVRGLRADMSVPGSVLAMSGESGLAGRIRAILDPGQARGAAGAGRVGVALVTGTICALAATSLVPVAVAQEGGAQEAPAATSDHAVGSSGVEVGVATVAVPAVGSVDAVGATSSDVASAASGGVATATSVGVVTAARAESTDVRADVVRQELCVFRTDGSRSTSMNVNDDRIRIRWETDDCRVDVEMEGEVVFAPDDSGIERMERGALVEIEERMGRSRRRARLEGEGGSSIERRFWIDGSEVAWGPQADDWLRRILPELFRHTTINAEARVRRMVAEGGAERVFQEVRLIRSDHVSRHYLETLMDVTALTDAQHRTVIEFAGALESDHAAGELILAVVERAGLQPGFQQPMLRAAEGLESDHMKGRVLGALLESNLTPAQLDAVVASSASIESDHTLSTVLSRVAGRGRLAEMDRGAFLDALATIDSDHATGVVIEAFLDADPLTPQDVSRILEMTEGIDSDHQRSMILQRVAREYRLTGPQIAAFASSARRLDSDHAIATTALAITDNDGFSAEQLGLVLDMADQAQSAHQKGAVLQEVIRRHDLEPRHVEGLLASASRITSDHELATTLVLLVEDERLDDEGVIGVLDVTRRMDSDHQRASVMTALARRHDIDGEARSLYDSLASVMGRHQREQVLSALRR